MKKIHQLVLGMILITIASCGGAETKADNTGEQPDTSSTYNKESTAGADQIPDAIPPAAAPPTKEDSITRFAGDNEILARIDNYIVSSPVYNSDGNGISNAVVTVKNTLADITIQKAIVEVNTLDAAGKVIRNDFYTIQNLEPGDIETIKIPASTKAASMISHVVKLKSNGLTNGEMMMVGSLYNSGK